MKLGNIIYESELINHKKSKIINYYEFNDLSKKKIDNNLPTLIVGWKLVKEILKESSLEISILEKRIVTNKLYWEHSFEDEKEEYTLGIKNFVDNVGFYYNLDKYKYFNLDPLFFNISDINELKNVLSKDVDGIYQYKNNMIYVLKEQRITGIDLDAYYFYGFDTIEIVKYLISICNNNENIFIDGDGSKFSSLRSQMPYFNKLKTYTLPLLMIKE